MFYAASEIIFWIALAGVVGGGIGYGLSEARSVGLNRRLSGSRADAPMERELAAAWDTIEELNRRLQVAHETIRSDSDTQTDAASSYISGADADEAISTPEPPAAASGNGVGTRLSQRVASASSANHTATEPTD